MSGRISVSFVDFTGLSFDFDRIRCALLKSFLVRSWCGPRPAVRLVVLAVGRQRRQPKVRGEGAVAPSWVSRRQLEQILTALRVRECSRRLELRPVRVLQVLRQACRENEQAALSKGIRIHMVSSDVSILSDSLLLGAVLRNLVRNAIKYTQPGGRVLLGCRHSGSSIRIDVYDTGIGISGEQMPKIFEAFTRLDAARCDGLGVGLFIVRQAIGILGHRIDVASTPCRGSRFSIFVARGTKRERTRASTAQGEKRKRN